MSAMPRPLRVAVEGCGHGTLDAIYASVAKTCEVNGWDGVDLLIICGDFQSVRHHQDLNVTAMPSKYRKLADFHRYYYGEKTAPYLTVFIGGNHEASNYLFELFYGGWVAPKIYYLGAANVIKFGGLKIAGMSGIFNFHDYTRPHFERLPYSDGTMRSIYHQREVDIRKLLAYRNQVDIGLSHDWPRGIEWFGNHDQLFAFKPNISEDAQRRRLGSEAAAQVMDRLRPLHWFSAHLHAKYAAQKTYGTVDDPVVVPAANIQQGETQGEEQAIDGEASNVADNAATTTLRDAATVTVSAPATHGSPRQRVRPENAVAVGGWTLFSNTVQQRDREEADDHQRQLHARQDERERTGQPAIVPYAFEETWKEVRVNNTDGIQERQSVSLEKLYIPKIPQIDGCCSSTLSPVKRRRPSTSDDDDRRIISWPQQTDGGLSPVKITSSVKVINPDAIDIDMSDSEEDRDLPLVKSFDREASKSLEGHGLGHIYGHNSSPAQGSTKTSPLRVRSSEEIVGMPLARRSSNSQDDPFQSSKFQISEPEPVRSITAAAPLIPHDPFYVPPAEINITKVPPSPSPPPVWRDAAKRVQFTDPEADDDSEGGHNPPKARPGRSAISIKGSIHDEPSEETDKSEPSIDTTDKNIAKADEEATTGRSKTDSVLDVPDDVREQLASMSANFLPEQKVKVSPPLSFPSETITNKTTNFLALSKAESGQNFLQLMEIPKKNVDPSDLPKLHYDPEFLAITRVFNAELVLGGSPNDKTPTHRGDTHYRGRIIEEEAWVKDNIVDKGLLVIPENFKTTSTGNHDPANTGVDQSMPREVTNPQTIAFCKMLGINNPFDISEEARDELMAAGPPADNQSGGHRGGRGSHRGGSHRGGPRGSHRGGRGGRGGRGRGRGRGQW